MTLPRAIALFVCCGLVGALVGYWTLPEPPAPRPPELLDAAPEILEPHAPPVVAAPLPSDTTALCQELAATLRRQSGNDVQRGEGVLRGRVLSHQDVGLEGAAIVAVLMPVRGGGTDGVAPNDPAVESRLDLPLADFLRRRAQRWLEGESSLLRGSTDAAGHFDITGAMQGRRYRVFASKPGYDMQLSRHGTSLVPDAERHTIYGRAVATLVLDIAAPHCLLARVAVNDGDWSWEDWHEWSPANPEIPLYERQQKIRVVAGDLESDWMRVDASPGERIELSVELGPRGRIDGQLFWPEGQPHLPVTVTCSIQPEGEEVADTWLGPGWGTSDAFSFSRLVAGEYEVLITGDELQPLRQIVRVADEVVKLEVEIPADHVARPIVVWPMAPGNQPVHVSSFSCRSLDDHGEEDDELDYDSLSHLARPDGSYWVWLDSCGGAAVQLAVKSDWYGAQFVDIEADVESVRVQFDPVAFVEVEIPDGLSMQLRNRARLSIRAPEQRVSAPIGGRSLVRLGPVAPGEASLTLAVHERASWDLFEIARQPIDITAGIQRVTLAWPDTVAVELLLPAVAAEKRVRLHRADGSEKSLSLQVSRSATIALAVLPTGSYRVVLLGEAQDIVVREPGVVDLRHRFALDAAPEEADE